MTKAKRWRYYCDHCGKAGGRADSMKKHERGCTKNPNRQCGMCDIADIRQKPLNEMVDRITKFIQKEKSSVDDMIKGNPQVIAELRDITEGCPACMLAITRQIRNDLWLEVAPFNYKEERDSFWECENEKKRQEAYY